MDLRSFEHRGRIGMMKIQLQNQQEL